MVCVKKFLYSCLTVSLKMPEISLGWFLILNRVWCVSSLKEQSKRTYQLWKVWVTFQLQKKRYQNWGYSRGRIKRPSVSPICTQGLLIPLNPELRIFNFNSRLTLDIEFFHGLCSIMPVETSCRIGIPMISNIFLKSYLLLHMFWTMQVSQISMHHCKT